MRSSNQSLIKNQDYPNRFSPADHPCIQLIVTETKPDCGELEDAVTKPEGSDEVAPVKTPDTHAPADLLPKIKEVC